MFTGVWATCCNHHVQSETWIRSERTATDVAPSWWLILSLPFPWHRHMDLTSHMPESLVRALFHAWVTVRVTDFSKCQRIDQWQWLFLIFHPIDWLIRYCTTCEKQRKKANLTLLKVTSSDSSYLWLSHVVVFLQNRKSELTLCDSTTVLEHMEAAVLSWYSLSFTWLNPDCPQLHTLTHTHSHMITHLRVCERESVCVCARASTNSLPAVVEINAVRMCACVLVCSGLLWVCKSLETFY